MSGKLPDGLAEKVDLETAEQVMSSETSSKKDPGANQRNETISEKNSLNLTCFAQSWARCFRSYRSAYHSPPHKVWTAHLLMQTVERTRDSAAHPLRALRWTLPVWLFTLRAGKRYS